MEILEMLDSLEAVFVFNNGVVLMIINSDNWKNVMNKLYPTQTRQLGALQQANNSDNHIKVALKRAITNIKEEILT